MTDIFKFWSMIGKAETIHPLDRPVFERLNNSHGFDLRCLPCNFGGKLRTAPVVLLYLSPGFSESDLRLARSKEGRERYVKQRTGRLGFTDDHPGGGQMAQRAAGLAAIQRPSRTGAPSPTSAPVTPAVSLTIMFSQRFPQAGPCSNGRSRFCFRKRSEASGSSFA
ncbi:hypothetical protein [Bradyrhizobium sp. LMG 9283]|uniref:hypothetical protein n=1 Tax=Bradyrhizobium sp. LMG 9283 TaxID=592064 RepID=UPI00388F9502